MLRNRLQRLAWVKQVVTVTGHSLMWIKWGTLCCVVERIERPRWISLRFWRPWGLPLWYFWFWWSCLRFYRVSLGTMWCTTPTGSSRGWIHWKEGPRAATLSLGSRRPCLLQNVMLLPCLGSTLPSTLSFSPLVCSFSLFSVYISACCITSSLFSS